MLIIPLTGKISKRNPPMITIGIIVINCFVFFVLQAGDTERHYQSTRFYFNSGLAKIEVPRYIAYLDTVEGSQKRSNFQKPEHLDKDTLERFYIQMQGDDIFIKRLLNDEIITPEEEIYTKWKGLRAEYEDLLSRVVYIRYGFKPAFKSLLTIFTHMFIHGSFMHILGNMIFLWLVGCILELGCGRIVYVVIYLLSGILSVELFSLVYMHSTLPLIGASGAISGLIGAYTVTYGRRKIKVFYSIGFYFNYVKVSGISLLPVWIGNEVFQLFFGGYSQTAYVAHIGGLISGGLIGYLNMKFLGRVDEEVFEEDPRKKIAPLLEQALHRMEKVDMDGARQLLEQIFAIDPDNREALMHLFNIDKLTPEGERFHTTASRLLLHLSRDKGAHEILYDIYKEYCHVSKRLRLSRDLLFRISLLFSAHGNLEESEKIMALLLRKHPTLQKLPTGILNLARSYLKKGMTEKGKRCLRVICQRYPESPEYQIAQRLLKSPNLAPLRKSLKA